jgi:hypothetical protein
MTRRERQLAEIALKLLARSRSASADERQTLGELMRVVGLEMRVEQRRAAKGRAHRAKYRPVGTISSNQ